LKGLVHFYFEKLVLLYENVVQRNALEMNRGERCIQPTNYITSRRNELRFLIASKDFSTKKMEYKKNDEKETVKICANMMAKIAFIRLH
jgi:uncharacterized protein YpmS